MIIMVSSFFACGTRILFCFPPALIGYIILHHRNPLLASLFRRFTCTIQLIAPSLRGPVFSLLLGLGPKPYDFMGRSKVLAVHPWDNQNNTQNWVSESKRKKHIWMTLNRIEMDWIRGFLGKHFSWRALKTALRCFQLTNRPRSMPADPLTGINPTWRCESNMEGTGNQKKLGTNNWKKLCIFHGILS